MRYRYRSEDELKDSGVEWLGKIPKDWEVSKLKYMCNFKRGYCFQTSEFGDESDIKFIATNNINNENVALESCNTSNKMLPKNFLIEEDDLLYCVTGSIGTMCTIKNIKNEKIYYHYNLCKVTTLNQNLKRYIYYLLKSDIINRQISEISKTTVINMIAVNVLNDFRSIIPNRKEQEKIANFLDEKTSQFDLIISKKEKLIERLEEAKKSLISEVVTGKVKVVKTDDGYELIKRSSEYMKDSGVEWLGDIPKDWKAKRIKYLFNIKKDIAGKLGYDVLSVTQSGIKIKDITKNEGQLSMDYSKYQIVDIGNFVMNHMDLLTGFVDCSKFKGVTSPDYRVFRLIDNNNCKQYYNYIFQLCYHNRVFYGLAQGVSGMGRWRLQTDTFKNFIVPIPSYKEQEEIAIVLQDKLNDIERLKNRLNLNIQKLKEAKQSLISEAVTGKIEILD